MVYDCIVIGAGPSGAQAGIYISRANKKVLVLHSGKHGALMQAKQIENYYGIKSTSGNELYHAGIMQLKDLGARVIEGVVSSVYFDYNLKLFKVSRSSDEYLSKTIIIATGRDKKKSFNYEITANNGVSYCALCDGFFYRNKKVAVIGNTEFALAEYKHLKDVTKDVTMLLNQNDINFQSSNKISFLKDKILKIK